MITIYQADAFKILPIIESESVDLIVTDPPWKDYKSNIRQKDTYKAIDTSGEVHSWVHTFANECYRTLKNNSHLYCFTDSLYYPMFYTALKYADFANAVPKIQNESIDYDDFNLLHDMLINLNPTQCKTGFGFNIKKLLYWMKPNHTVGDLEGDYGERFEPIIFAHKGIRKLYGKRRQNSLVFDRVPQNKTYHPTQKPVDLLEVFVNKSSDEGDLILDPFGGSMSTAIAAENLGRNSIVIENDENYVKKMTFWLKKNNYNVEVKDE